MKIPKDIDDILSNMILFSAIWSFGSAMEENSRKAFDKFIRKLITANSEIPEEF